MKLETMKFSVITPSYNQGQFIERTIQSVLKQSGSFHIEYSIVDGGSSDDTVAIMSNYEKIMDDNACVIACDGITFSWVSEKDDGQADAINKGIARTSGEIIAWINSDDIYYPGAFEHVRRIFEEKPDVDVVYGFCNHIDEHDGVIESYPTEPWDYARLFDKCYICQPGAFFRRSLIDEYGPLDALLKYCMDYELWLRFGKSACFFYLEKLLAGSRMYSENKTLGQRVAVHYEINEMFREKFGKVPRKWIYGYAEVVAEEKMKEQRLEKVDLDLVREIAQDAFLRWWGSIPARELDYMDKFLSNPGTKMWPVRRKLSGLEELRIGFDVASMSPCDDFGLSTQMMINTMADKYPDDKFILYKSFGSSLSAPEYSESDSRIKKPNVHYALTDLNDEEAKDFWSDLPHYALLSLGYPDIIHCNNFFCPDISEAKIVYTLYDLSFLDYPEFTTPKHLSVYKKGLDAAAKYADMIIAISDYSRDRFLRYYPEYPASRIRTVHLASRMDRNLVAKPVHGFTTGNFWLSVCTLEPRKNLKGLIKAYRIYVGDRKDVPPLVLVGGKGWLEDDLPEFIETLGLKNHVIIAGYRDDSELKWMYENCLAFCYPSFYEGFGLPVLEAMGLGAPVIVSNATSLPEVAGDAGFYVTPDDADEIAAAMRRLESDAQLRSDLKKRGLVQAVKFSWEETARKIHEIYLEVASTPKRKSIGLNEDKSEVGPTIYMPAENPDSNVYGASTWDRRGDYVIMRLESDYGPLIWIKAQAYRWITRRPGLKTYIKRFRFSRSLVRRLQKNILGY